MKFSNFEDSKCAFGYITLCEICEKHIRRAQIDRNPRYYQRINLNKKVEGFPLNPRCEECGVRSK